MYSIENHVGRLIELRFESPITLDELTDYSMTAAKVLRPHSELVVGCTDLLNARIFSQVVTDQLTKQIRVGSPRIERSAFLVGESAVFSMQIERVLREAGYANRRAFQSTTELSLWLGELLTSAERQRLAIFLRDAVARHRAAK
jgi:hypothetical protein